MAMKQAPTHRVQSTIDLPYPHHAVAQKASSYEAVELTLGLAQPALPGSPPDSHEAELLAIVGAFLSRVTGTRDFVISLADTFGVADFQFDLTEVETFDELCSSTLGELRRCRHRGALLGNRPRPSAPESTPFAVAIDHQTPVAELALLVRDSGTHLLRYDEARYPRSSVVLIAAQLSEFSERLHQAQQTPIAALSLLGKAQRERVLKHWNDTAVALDGELVLPRAFSAQVARTPHAPALAFRDQVLSYLELDQRAGRLARRLRSRGVGPEVRVGIYAERTLELVVAVLAVHKAGGAYVPLDPSFPTERVDFMIADTGMTVLLTQPHLHAKLSPISASVLYTDDEPWDDDALPFDDRLAPEHLAYVLFTSGSTGRPKGVMVEHRNVSNLFTAMDRLLAPAEPGVWLAVTSLSFDISVVELLWTLSRGFKVVLYREPARDGADARPEESFAQLVQRHAVTHLQCTPTMANMFLADPAARTELSRLHELILAGEAYPIALARQLRTYSQATLRNLYGPTETTVYSVGHVVVPWSESVPIGRPLANTQVYVLDAAGQPVPEGVPGELYIGGAGVSRGYLGRPDLSAERFVRDPFSADPTARLYRTGDRVRFRPNGVLDFLGRLDNQVKIRGYRLELGEIEAVLIKHPGVREAVLTVREDIPGNKRLVAYVVPGRLPAPTAQELKSCLRDHLPSYMVPASFVFLDGFPQTTSGKVDRQRLPAPESLRAKKSAAVQPPGASPS
jgi:amino acid adenylation domain-containing protein